MKSFAEPRRGLMMLVGALSVTLAAPLCVSPAMAQDQPPPVPPEGQNTSQDVAAQRAALRQQALVEYDAAYNSAREALANGQFDDAQQRMSTGMAALDARRDVLGESEYHTLRAKGEALQTDISNARETDRIKRENEDRIKAQQAKEQAAEAERKRRQQQIDESLKRVRQLQQELKFDEALQVCDEILFLDEMNPSALALRDVINTTKLYRDYSETQKYKERGFSEMSLENQKSMIVPHRNITGPGPKSVSDIVEYPADWPQTSMMRAGGVAGFSESEGNRSVRQRLMDTKVPVDFNNNTLEQVVSYLQQVSGVDIYVDYKALGNAGIDRSTPVTLKLQDTSVATALERVLEQLGEGQDRPQWDVQDGVLTVSSDEAMRKRTMLRVYDIRDLLMQVPTFDNAPKLDLDNALNQGQNSGGGSGGGGGGGSGGFGGGGGGGSGGGSGSSGSIFGTSSKDEAPRLSRDELVQQIVQIIQENVDPEGWRDLGGDTGSLQELNGNLIITNTPNNHRSIEGLLAQLREIRALQINVESRFLTVATDWFEQIGVDLDLYFNTNNDMFNAARAVDPNFHLSDFFNPDGSLKDPVVFGNFAQVDPNLGGGPPFNTVPTGNITGVPTGTPPTTITNVIGPVGSPIRNQSGFSPIGINQHHFDLIQTLADFDPASFAGVALANPAISMGLQFLDDIQVNLLIEATQADRRSVTLTAPRLTFFNGQRSWVAVTTQQAYVSNLTAITGDASGAFQPNIATLQDGFVLDVEGVISADRRYVTLTVIFDFAEFLGFRQSSAADFSGAAGGGGGVGGGGNAAQFTGAVELPILRVSQIRTTASVPDKGTVLLGGQRSVTEIELETGVPVLSKIPFINRFFTNRVTSKTEQTLLILIRPEIIIQQENEDLLFPGLSDNLGGAASYLR